MKIGQKIGAWIALAWDWIHFRSPPWVNLPLTAGFHTTVTFLAGFFGMAPHLLVTYYVLEGRRPVNRAFALGSIRSSLREWLTPSDTQRSAGWTRGWLLADHVADVVGPTLAALYWWLR